MAVGREPRTVTRTIPGLFLLVPLHLALFVRADGTQRVKMTVLITVQSCVFVFYHLAFAGLKIVVSHSWSQHLNPPPQIIIPFEDVHTVNGKAAGHTVGRDRLLHLIKQLVWNPADHRHVVFGISGGKRYEV